MTSDLSNASIGFSQRTLAQLMDTLDVLRPYFNDEGVNEIMINGPDDVFVKIKGTDRKLTVKLPGSKIRSAITLIASLVQKEVGEKAKQLILSARLPGFRVEAVLPPVAVKGPTMCIRRHATQIFTLEDYVSRSIMTETQAEIMFDAVTRKESFLIVGGTGSGKTTLMNTALGLVPKTERLFVIETVHELKISAPNAVLIECDEEQGITPRKAVKTAMRYAPDRIILGELRGAEAYDWMDAANTGHHGSASTIHANSADRALGRLENLLLMANMGVPYEPLRTNIAETLRWMFYIERRGNERRLTQIARLNGYDPQSNTYDFESFSQ